jgi:hypothetical protein
MGHDPGDLGAVEHHAPGMGPQLADDALEQGRLADAVRADHGRQPARLRRERESAQDVDVAHVAGVEVAYFEHHAAPAPAWRSPR